MTSTPTTSPATHPDADTGPVTTTTASGARITRYPIPVNRFSGQPVSTRYAVYATFSADAGVPAAIYVTSGRGMAPLVSILPGTDANPLTALAQIGYKIDPVLAYQFADTMAATGHARVRVSPID
jgi:hypothetical protein